jgi:DNA-binding NarL/FixJ family response regulator
MEEKENRKVKTTEKQKREILKLHEKGLSLVKIAKLLNMTRSTVGYHSHGVIHKEHSAEFKAKVETILELRKQGLTNEKIAEKLGLSFRQVYYIVVKGKIGNRPRKTLPTEKIIQAFEAGQKVKEIAENLGFSRDTIRLTLHNLGLTKPLPRKRFKPQESVSH